MEKPKKYGTDSPILAAYALAALAVLFWGGTPVANKIAVATIDPATTGVLRAILAGPIAILLVFALKLPFPKSSHDRLLLVVSGITSFAIWPTLLSIGISLTTAAHAGLILAQIPIFTGLFAALVNRKWPGFRWWIGSIVAVVGTFFLILYRNGTTAEDASITGDLVVLAGVIACSIGYIAGGKLSPVIGTWATTFWGIALAAVTLVPVGAILLGRTNWSAVDGISWFAMSYLVILGTIGCYLAWFWALGRGGITRISSWQLAQPVITLILAAILLGELITFPLIAVAGVIVAGAAYTQLPAKHS